MNASTDWQSAVAILAAGLILGLLVFVASRRRKAAAIHQRGTLEARRDALVQQLCDLGEDVADDERAWLESETAEVLRALDRLPAEPAAEAAPVPRRRPAVAAFVYGVLCTLVAGGVVWYGSTFVRERNAPANDEQQLAAARDALARSDLMASFEQSKAVLDRNPNDARALTYNAVVRMAMGELDAARTMLEQATQRDPKLLDGWVALANARMHSGDVQGASAAMNAAIAQHPEEEQRLRGVFAEMQKQSTGMAPSSDLPPDHPPLPSAEPAAAVPTSEPIRVTLSLDAAATVKSGIVYVIARGAEAGHPLAVRRIEAAEFPLSVDLGGSDSMMGQPLPAKVRIEARLDSDGDAGTNDPADPRAFMNDVDAGSAVTLTLAKAN